MLARLMKYEIKATARYFLPLYGAILILAFLIGIRDFGAPGMRLLNFILPTTLGFAIVALLVLTFLMVVKRFDANLLGDEGYLMFTLPVKTGSLLNAKLLVSLFWIVVSVLVFFASMLLITYQQLPFPFRMMGFRFLGEEPVFVLLVLSLALMSAVNFLLHIYASLSMAQAYSITKNRILGGVVVFIGIAILFNILESAGFLFLGMLSRRWDFIRVLLESIDRLGGQDTLNIVQWLLFFSLLYTVLKNVLFYAVTHYHLKHRLNLE